MPQLKVLFADDHIPAFSVPQDDKEARGVVQKQHPGCSQSDLERWIILHRHCQGVTQTLRSADFDVTAVNKYKSAIETARLQGRITSTSRSSTLAGITTTLFRRLNSQPPDGRYATRLMGGARNTGGERPCKSYLPAALGRSMAVRTCLQQRPAKADCRL